MPAFAKNPKFIIGTIVVLWVAYVIYANFQIDMVTFYLLPFNILKLQLRLSAVIIGAAIFGSVATMVIHWLWVRPSNSSSAVTAPIRRPLPEAAPSPERQPSKSFQLTVRSADRRRARASSKSPSPGRRSEWR